MKKIVLTGGPCSGKTITLRALKKEFGDQIVLVPEVATILLEGGFPIPDKDLEWSEKWQAFFQAAVLPLQKSFEDAYSLLADKNGSKLLVCDRGILDGAAYTPGGITEFCKRYKINLNKSYARYEAIIHLESLSTANPKKYGKTNNNSRFESLERAQFLEKETRNVWKKHSHYLIIGGKQTIRDKVEKVIKIITDFIS
jgi:predicted ATPase